MCARAWGGAAGETLRSERGGDGGRQGKVGPPKLPRESPQLWFIQPLQ